MDVEYDECKQREFVSDIFDKYIELLATQSEEHSRLFFASELWHWGINNKHPSFAEEKEARLIRTFNHGEPNWTRGINYRISDFGLSTYFMFPYVVEDVNPLVSVTLGPMNPHGRLRPLNEQHLQRHFSDLCGKRILVQQSSSSFRTNA